MHPRDQRLIGFAREMRQDEVPPAGPVGPYIADFLCAEAKLTIEVDGGQHGGVRDEQRDVWLEAQGYRVIRLWNSEVLEHGDEGAHAALEVRLGLP